MGDPSFLLGRKCPLPSPGLVHEYFEHAVQDNPYRAATSGVYCQGKFCSYSNLNTLASRAAVGLGMGLAQLKHSGSRTGNVFSYDFSETRTCNGTGRDGSEPGTEGRRTGGDGCEPGWEGRRTSGDGCEPEREGRRTGGDVAGTRGDGCGERRLSKGSEPHHTPHDTVHTRDHGEFVSRYNRPHLSFRNPVSQHTAAGSPSSVPHTTKWCPPARSTILRSSPLSLDPPSGACSLEEQVPESPTCNGTDNACCSNHSIRNYISPKSNSVSPLTRSYSPCLTHSSSSPTAFFRRTRSTSECSSFSPSSSPPRPSPTTFPLRSPEPSLCPRVIAVDIQPSSDLLVILIAILRLGLAYLPVDSQSAINRVRYILNEAKPVCVIADNHSAFMAETHTVWSGWHIINSEELLVDIEDITQGDVISPRSVSGNKTTQIVTSDVMSDTVEERKEAHMKSYVDNAFSNKTGESDDENEDRKLLAIIYTSGSAGKPKGVRIAHTSVMNRLSWQWDVFPFPEASVGCFKTSLLFVDSIVEIFSSVLQLVSMVIAPKGLTSNPEGLVALLEEYQVSRLVMVPSLLRSLLFYLSISGGKSRLPALRDWVCNSETLLPSLLRKFFDTFPDGRFFSNYYGSTETMADVTYEVFTSPEDIQTKSLDNILSIGRPMYNSHVYIVNEKVRLVSRGEVGEICVSGLNVADRYLDEMKSEAFIPNPFSEDPLHSALYRSGDFGRIVKTNTDGEMIIYEGRRDLQVKIRGQRVNITEIERVVQDVEAVERVMVLVHRFSPISEVIVAYYTTRFEVDSVQYSNYSKVDRSKNSNRSDIDSSRRDRDLICGPVEAGSRISAINKKDDKVIKIKHGRSTHLESKITQACRRSLPPYMHPKLLHLDEFPLQLHTGKVDRVALRRLYEKAFNRQSSHELAILDQKSQKALNIIALNLNLPTHGVPKHSSFFELGGTSVTMMSTIVQLRQHGLHIPIEIFSSAKNIQELIDQVVENSEPIGEILRTDQYVVMAMHDVPENEMIVDVLSDSFVEKEPLDVLLGVTKEEFMPFALSLYQEAARGRLSLIVLDKDTHMIVGGDFLFDYFREVCVKHHEAMSPILTLFREFEEPIKSQLSDAKPGPLLHNFCLCVHKDLPHGDQVKICHLIEGHVIQVAKANGFVGVVTNNTNPVTQDICQYFYEYQCLSSLLVRDFTYNERKVFAHAPEDYNIKMMIKYI